MKPIFIFFLLIAAASAVDIPLGSTLFASDPNSRWSSPNNTFSLSFISDPSETLIAAVAYDNEHRIWQAGASANSSAVLRIHPSGDLHLLPSSTSSTPLWSSGTANLAVSAASLDESGNFVLKNSSGASVWSTCPNSVLSWNEFSSIFFLCEAACGLSSLYRPGDEIFFSFELDCR